jgi:hypothetical protein
MSNAQQRLEGRLERDARLLQDDLSRAISFELHEAERANTLQEKARRREEVHEDHRGQASVRASNPQTARELTAEVDAEGRPLRTPKDPLAIAELRADADRRLRAQSTARTEKADAKGETAPRRDKLNPNTNLARAEKQAKANGKARAEGWCHALAVLGEAIRPLDMQTRAQTEGRRYERGDCTHYFADALGNSREAIAAIREVLGRATRNAILQPKPGEVRLSESVERASRHGDLREVIADSAEDTLADVMVFRPADSAPWCTVWFALAGNNTLQKAQTFVQLDKSLRQSQRRADETAKALVVRADRIARLYARFGEERTDARLSSVNFAAEGADPVKGKLPAKLWLSKSYGSLATNPGEFSNKRKGLLRQAVAQGLLSVQRSVTQTEGYFGVIGWCKHRAKVNAKRHLGRFEYSFARATDADLQWEPAASTSVIDEVAKADEARARRDRIADYIASRRRLGSETAFALATMLQTPSLTNREVAAQTGCTIAAVENAKARYFADAVEKVWGLSRVA